MRRWIICACAAVGLLFQQVEGRGYPETSLPPASYGRILGTGEHQIYGFTSDGMIEIENSAKFQICRDDVHKTHYWKPGDHITFSPNSSVFADSEFYVTNYDQGGEFIRANLFGGPFYDNPATDRIFQIDFKNKEVVLKNGYGYKNRFAIEPSDMHHLENCQLGETAMIGTNNSSWLSWFVSSPLHILVSYENGEFFTFVRCTHKPL